jgi:predicted neuraminidase
VSHCLDDQPRCPIGTAVFVPKRTSASGQDIVLRAGKSAYWATLLTTAVALGYRSFPAEFPTRSLISSAEVVASDVVQSVFAQQGVVPIAADELDIITSAEQSPSFTRHFFDAVPEAPSVHASTITMLPDGGLLAAWFGGTREGASDVSIYQSCFNRQTRSWAKPSVVTNRSQASRELGRHVKKLGNPVLFADCSGRIWLYFVTVSVGGWSGGSISVKFSDDQGETWSAARRLITSPFLNVSTLVRATPIALEDGGLLLPVYHECLCQFGELLRLDATGRLIHKYRMNSGGDLLQPTLAPISATELLAFYRRGARTEPELFFNRSTDVGQTWSELKPTNLPNPNASVAVIRTHGGNFLMSFNPSELSREQLAIASSSDGENWQVLEIMEAGAPGQEFSYPTLICGQPGVYHLTYTWNREKICHVTFNDAWVEARR